MYKQVFIDLCIERKVKQFQIFQERPLQSVTLNDVRLPSVHVVDHSVSDRLLRIIHCVVHVNLRIPVLIPVDRFRILHNRNGTLKAKGVKYVRDRGCPAFPQSLGWNDTYCAPNRMISN